MVHVLFDVVDAIASRSRRVCVCVVWRACIHGWDLSVRAPRGVRWAQKKTGAEVAAMFRMPPCEVGAGRVGGAVAVAVADEGRPLATLETRAAAMSEKVCMTSAGASASASTRADMAEELSSDRTRRRMFRMVK